MTENTVNAITPGAWTLHTQTGGAAFVAHPAGLVVLDDGCPEAALADALSELSEGSGSIIATIRTTGTGAYPDALGIETEIVADRLMTAYLDHGRLGWSRAIHPSLFDGRLTEPEFELALEHLDRLIARPPEHLLLTNAPPISDPSTTELSRYREALIFMRDQSRRRKRIGHSPAQIELPRDLAASPLTARFGESIDAFANHTVEPPRAPSLGQPETVLADLAHRFDPSRAPVGAVRIQFRFSGQRPLTLRIGPFTAGLVSSEQPPDLTLSLSVETWLRITAGESHLNETLEDGTAALLGRTERLFAALGAFELPGVDPAG